MVHFKSSKRLPTRPEKITALKESLATLFKLRAELDYTILSRHAVRNLNISVTSMRKFLRLELKERERGEIGIPMEKNGRGEVIWYRKDGTPNI